MELIIILLLIIISGIFAMTEIAIVSSRKSKLQQMAQKGNDNAKKALELANNPNKLLSTVQIGITFVGIFTGAYSGETLTRYLSYFLSRIPILGNYSDIVSLVTVVSIITYLSLVFGELVPKRLALSNPEAIAAFMAKFMHRLSNFSFPVINLLSRSTDKILDLFKVKSSDNSQITEDEVKMLIKEGARVGVFNLAQKDIVERTFRLSDQKANMLMTPRKEIKWLEINQKEKVLRKIISDNPHSYFPVCKNNIDKIIGVVRTKEILISYLTDEKLDLTKSIHKPIFIPESMNALKVFELFKKSGIHIALVVDEYGNTGGLLTITDLLEAIVGDIPTIDELPAREITPRDDGSWLVDGLVSVEDFKDHFKISKFPDEGSGIFHTVGGFVMHRIGRVPKEGNSVECAGFNIEVVDMDGNRVDKILVKKPAGKILKKR